MRTEELIDLFNIVPIYSALPTFAEAKALLRASGELIDDLDLLIAATAIHNNMVLVSENIRHVGRVPKVKTVNWIKR